MDSLPPKWNPSRAQAESYEATDGDEELEENTFRFNARITTQGTTADIFRIFTQGEKNTTNRAPDVRPLAEPEDAETTVYTDGSALNNGGANVRAGAGIFFGTDDPRNRSLRTPAEWNPSNQVGELAAVKEAAEMCPIDTPLRIVTDSMYTINAMTKNLQKWEDDGFHIIENGELARLTATKLRERRAPTTFQWVKGHSGDAGNEAADVLAGEGSRSQEPDEIRTQINPAYLLPGAKLKTLTQSTASKIIRRIKMKKPSYRAALDRKTTKRNMRLARGAAAEGQEKEPTEAAVWNSTRHRDFARNIRVFLWKMLHGGYKVGEYWSNIPGHEEKAECNKCGVYDSMEHILVKCDCNGQALVWELTRLLWRKKTKQNLGPTIGRIMACGTMKLDDKGAERLYRIIVSESAHLIWKLRCERVIQEKDEASDTEIQNRWRAAINSRLQMDCARTNVSKYGKKALKAKVVKRTWRKVLDQESKLPKDWTSREAGVLVGVG